jgi:hypothetical protein
MSDIGENAARLLTDLLIMYHEKELHGDDEEARNAVVVKMIAMTAVAFDIPPNSSDTRVYDIDDTCDRLRAALKVLRRKGMQ